MSTHNMFSWRNKKNINTFGFKKASYQELWGTHKKYLYVFMQLKEIQRTCILKCETKHPKWVLSSLFSSVR